MADNQIDAGAPPGPLARGTLPPALQQSRKIATPLASEVLRQNVPDWWKGHVQLAWS